MNSVISLITLYNPTISNIKNIEKISEQSTLVLLIDNSEHSSQSIIDKVGTNENVIYCPNYDNLGLSLAFNKYLKASEIYSWQDDDLIVFFDQDSVIEEFHISNMVNEYINLENEGYPVGCLGPVYFDLSHNTVRVPKMYKKISHNSIVVDTIITSSMVCRYRYLKLVGFWSEDIFLDMADWDLCWKMKQAGLYTIMTRRSLLTHKVGEGSKKIGLITLDVGKPFREYYETRDCIYLLRKNYVPCKDRVRFYLQLTIRPILHLLFLDNKKERWYYISLGFKHAKKGVCGKISSSMIYNSLNP